MVQNVSSVKLVLRGRHAHQVAETLSCTRLSRKQLVLLLLALLVGSSQALRAQDVPDYWPLELGNSWVYNHTWIDDGVEFDEVVTLEVVGESRVGDHTYFEMSNGQLLRKDDEGNVIELNQFERPDDPEVIVFDMTNIGDTQYRISLRYTIFPPTLGLIGTVSPARTTDPLSITVPAGVFEVITFTHGDLGGFFSVALARDVGPVRSTFFSDIVGEDGKPLSGASFELAEYRTGGRNYPSVVKDRSWGELKSERDTANVPR